METKHYNHFTIAYIEAILKNLDIRVLNDSVQFFPDTTFVSDFDNLKTELDEIWDDAQSAINLLEQKKGALIQNALFGLVNDFDLALRTGYLLGDRVVVIDYIYERILSRRKIKSSEILRVGDLCKNLVQALDLAKDGKFVILPNPFSWNKKTRKLIKKTSKITMMSPQTMSLLNILSISNKCNLHPYTIAESDEEYARLLNENIETFSEENKNEAVHIYRKLLAGLLSEKILTRADFEINSIIPLNQYASIIENEKDFYQNYLKKLTQGGKNNSEYNLENLKLEIHQYLQSKHRIMAKNGLKKVSKVSAASAATVTILGGLATLNPGLIAIGTSLGLIPSFTDLLKEESLNETATISVFQKLRK